MDFKIYFFKENNKSIDFQNIFNFFEQYPECEYRYSDDLVEILYNDTNLLNKARFCVTKKSTVPNLYKLSPKFKNLNFHIEILPLIPMFKANIIFNIVQALTSTFDLSIYCEYFENILPYRNDLVVTAYEYFRKAYQETDRAEYNRMVYVEKERLNNILKYHLDNVKLQIYYLQEEIYAPRYIYLLDPDSRYLYTAIEWKEDTKTIFPPYLDFVFYKEQDKTTLYKYTEVLKNIDRFLLDLPGSIKGTKFLDESDRKKANKVMKKEKLVPVNRKYEKVEVDRLIDLPAK